MRSVALTARGDRPATAAAAIGMAAFCSSAAVMPARGDCSAGSARAPGVRQQSIEILDAADQAAAEEADQQHEDDAEHQFPGGAEMQRGLEEIAEIKPHGGADQRSEQRAGAADRGLHHELARSIECEGVGRHEALHQAEQTAGKSGIGRGDDEGGELVAVDVVAEGRRALRIVADRAQDRADRRAHDAQRDHDADEIPECQERIERRSRY